MRKHLDHVSLNLGRTRSRAGFFLANIHLLLRCMEWGKTQKSIKNNYIVFILQGSLVCPSLVNNGGSTCITWSIWSLRASRLRAVVVARDNMDCLVFIGIILCLIWTKCCDLMTNARAKLMLRSLLFL